MYPHVKIGQPEHSRAYAHPPPIADADDHSAIASPASSAEQPLHHFSATGPAAMATEGPLNSGVEQSPAAGRYDSTESNSSKSPLSMGLGFLRNLAEKKITRDGQTPKRRGPKPDSKPALTRRQELNRQAQRTHRERKELYIKALEQEVVRLKESFSLLTQERAAVDEENRRLKEILLQNGISWPNAGNGAIAFAPGASSSGSISGSYAAGPGSQGFSPTLGSAYSQAPPAHNGPGIPQQQHGVDYDQIGIDFVLTLEHPCMDHMLYLCLQAQNDDEDISGHALMASCPPESHLLHHPDIPFPYKTWDIQKSDLANLMDLSKRLNLDGEITPVMAWATILSHPRFGELTKLDFDVLVDDLKAKVRCYGFGAVLEEFEVRDALSNLFATKLEDL